MIRVGILTADSPEKDRSILVFSNLKRDYNCEIEVINPFTTELEKVDNLDVIYPRITGEDENLVNVQIDFLTQLIEKKKIPYIGNLNILRDQKDKYFQTKKAKEAGLNVPETILIENLDKISNYTKRLSFPMILKATHSFGGKDVYLVDNATEIKKIITSQSKQYILQEFVKLEQIIDYRVYVVGGEVVGGLKRANKTEGEFRTNTTQGAKAWFFYPEPELALLAKKFADYLKLEIVCVDFIRKEDKYIFIEMNDAFSVNIKSDKEKRLARQIIKYCLSKV